MGYSDVDEIKSVLDYDPSTGIFHWKISFRNNQVKVGSVAGSINNRDGRLFIRFRGKLYRAHRLAWLLTYGEWPKDQIDHIDGNPLNNRIDNLRDVSNKVNGQNKRRARSDSRVGILGVSPYGDTGKFVSKIKVDEQQVHLGIFSTAQEAHAAYLEAKREFHEGCTI